MNFSILGDRYDSEPMYVLSDDKKIIGLCLDDLTKKILSDLNLNQFNNTKFLRLNHCKLNDISLLKELKSLIVLYIEYNHISDISPLKELKNLMGLYLGYNQINDISPERIKEFDNVIFRR